MYCKVETKSSYTSPSICNPVFVLINFFPHIRYDTSTDTWAKMEQPCNLVNWSQYLLVGQDGKHHLPRSSKEPFCCHQPIKENNLIIVWLCRCEKKGGKKKKKPTTTTCTSYGKMFRLLKLQNRERQDSNLRGQSPHDF